MRKMTLASLVLFLLLSLAVMSALADEKGGIKADGKKTAQKKAAKPTKCWQKLPPLDERNMSPEYNTVCKAYEEVLNTTCEPPEKLGCNWTLPEGEKRFKKLEWQPLEPKEYWGLIEDIALSGWNEKYREEYRGIQWARLEPEYKKELEQGNLRLSLTTVDIIQDGKKDRVVSLKRGVCRNIGWQYVNGVMNPETKRMDWERNKVFFHDNGSGLEIMLYEGQAFMFVIDNNYYEPVSGHSSKEVMLYEGYSYGALNECRFKYLKGGAKQ